MQIFFLSAMQFWPCATHFSENTVRACNASTSYLAWMWFIICHKIHLDLQYNKKSSNEWMCECVLVLWLCPCSCLTSFLWISGIFACFTLSVSPCLPPPPPLFSFVSLPPSSLHPAIQNQSTPHSQTSGKVRSFHYLSSYAEGRPVDGRRRASPAVVYQSLWSSALPESLTSSPSTCMLLLLLLLPRISAWPFSSCCMCQNSGCFVVSRHL